MTVDFEKHSSKELASAAVKKTFEKKYTRVITSLIALCVSAFCLRELHSGWNIMYNTWFSYILTVLLFAAMIMSIAALVSNCGSVKKWKFVSGALISAVMLWIAISFLSVFTAIYIEDFSAFMSAALQYAAPMIPLAMGIVLTLGIVFFNRKHA